MVCTPNIVSINMNLNLALSFVKILIDSFVIESLKGTLEFVSKLVHPSILVFIHIPPSLGVLSIHPMIVDFRNPTVAVRS
jgi:hypothetical protein